MSIRKRQGSWEANVYIRNTGRRYTKTFASKREAEAWEASMKTKLNRGSIHDPSEGKMTFGRYAQYVIDNRSLSVNTRRGYVNHLRRLMPYWGNRRLDSLRYSDAVALQKSIAVEHSGNGALNSLVFARSVMNTAMFDGIIERSPFLGLRLGKPKEKREVKIPTWLMVRSLVEGRTGSKTPSRMTKRQVLVAVAAGTGLRGAEILGLSLDSVDFLRREITVRQTLNHINQTEARKIGLDVHGYYVKSAKSEAGQDRVVPVPQWTLDVLSMWLEENPPAEIETPLNGPEQAKTVRLRLIFGLMTGTNLSTLIRKAPWPDGGTYSPHDLRKLFATELEQSGLPPTTLRSILGHEGQGVTSLYVLVDPKTLDQARRILTAAWEGAAPEPPATEVRHA